VKNLTIQGGGEIDNQKKMMIGSLNFKKEIIFIDDIVILFFSKPEVAE
jgi:hypothetical protein